MSTIFFDFTIVIYNTFDVTLLKYYYLSLRGIKKLGFAGNGAILMANDRKLNEWAQGIVYEVYNYWTKIKDSYNFSDSGFSVFYSPIKKKPRLMIIGYNPGGSSESFDVKKSLEIPLVHEYFIEDYKLAKRSKEVFAAINKMEILKDSVKLNLYFIRSNNKKQYMTIKKEIREPFEKFCVSKIVEIINILQPEIILTEGVETFDILRRVLFKNCHILNQLKGNNTRLLITARCDNILLLGLIHLSGAWIKEEDFIKIQNELKKIF